LLSIGSDQALVDDLGRFYVDPTTVDTSLTSIDALYDPLRLMAEKLDLDLSALKLDTLNAQYSKAEPIVSIS
jgi:hypothetical protein